MKLSSFVEWLTANFFSCILYFPQFSNNFEHKVISLSYQSSNRWQWFSEIVSSTPLFGNHFEFLLHEKKTNNKCKSFCTQSTRLLKLKCREEVFSGLIFPIIITTSLDVQHHQWNEKRDSLRCLVIGCFVHCSLLKLINYNTF